MKDRDKYDRQLIKWVKDHYWDSLEKDKDLILRHLRTFATGDEFDYECQCHPHDFVYYGCRCRITSSES